MVEYLLARSEGIIGELATLLTGAAVAAVTSGIESINDTTLTITAYCDDYRLLWPDRTTPPVRAATVTATRWPVHPAPTPGQAASSWLSRLAAALHVDVDALFADVGYHLDGPARTPLPDQPR